MVTALLVLGLVALFILFPDVGCFLTVVGLFWLLTSLLVGR